MDKSMYAHPRDANIIDKLKELGDEVALHSMGFPALERLRIEASKIADEKRAPLRILEIGAYRCYSTVVLSQYGWVVSLDIRDLPESQKVIDLSPYKENIIRVLAYNQALARTLTTSFLPVDLVVVDVDHSFQGVQQDINFTYRQSRNYIFHDYSDSFPGCKKAVDKFVEDSGGEFTLFEGTSGLCKVVIPKD